MTSPRSDPSEAETGWIPVLQDGAELVRPYVQQTVVEPTTDGDGSGDADGPGAYPAIGALGPQDWAPRTVPVPARPVPGRRTAGRRGGGRTALLIGAGVAALAALGIAAAGASDLLSGDRGDGIGQGGPLVSVPLASAAPGSSLSPSGGSSSRRTTAPAAALPGSAVTSTPTPTVLPSTSASVTASPTGDPQRRNGPGGSAPANGANEALNAQATDSGHTQTYTAANAVDGQPDSYWESTDNAFPQSLTVDLGADLTVGRLVLRLPPLPAWTTRTETFAVLAGTDGSSFSTLVGPSGHTFDPGSGNTVTLTLPAHRTARYLRLTFSGNTGWPAGQLSELQVYSS
jgi:hypothetical protein